MKILLFGKNGQVGWELQRSLAPLGELTALGSKDTSYCGDLLNTAGIAQTIRAIKPDVIVNAAAYTAVDKAEAEQETARSVNASALAVIAEEAKQIGALLVHYSTDYVFDGSGQLPWKETDRCRPLSVYGQTKLDGEMAIINSGCKYLIFRTSWVYAARGGNFAKTMLRLAQEREQLNVIDDQFGAPTGAELIADVTAQCLVQARRNPEVQGLYHLVAGGETTWFHYARYVIGLARKAGVPIKVQDEAVKPIPTTAYPLPAARPLNSRLNTQKLQSTFNLTLPDWQAGVERMLLETGDRK